VSNFASQRTKRTNDGIAFKFAIECWLYDNEFERFIIPPEFFRQKLNFELTDRVDFHPVIVDRRIVVDTGE